MQIESGYHESEDAQTITLGLRFTRDEWDRLVFMLGLATILLHPEGKDGPVEDKTDLFWPGMRLVNKIMEGNPNWTPYWTPGAKAKP